MKCIRLLFPFLLIALLQCSCSRLPITGRLPENLTAEKIADVDENSPLAISPDGMVAALCRSGLKLFHIPTRQQVEVSDRTPHKLAWSPAGSSLAATYPEEGKSTIVTFDQYGAKVAETSIDGNITDLAWLSENELLAASAVITSYKFGSNYKTVLHRWLPGRSEPTTTPLRDTTLQPVTARKWLPLLLRGPMLDLARSSDHILYLQPIDPPLFTPYYKLLLRDLASGKELEVGSVAMTTSGAKFTADGELIIYGNGADTTTVQDPWSGETVASFTASGKDLAISPSGDYRFADGALYHGANLISPLVPGGTARFTSDGKQLLVSADGDLYLLKGLQPADDKLLPPPQLKKILQPRSWRIDGLISAKEYKESLERIKQQ